MLLIASASAYVICLGPQITESLPAAGISEVPAGTRPGFVITNMCAPQDSAITLTYTLEGETREKSEIALVPVVGMQRTELAWLDFEPLQPGQYELMSDRFTTSFTVTDQELEVYEGGPEASFVDIKRKKDLLTATLDMKLMDIEPGMSLLSFEDADGNPIAAAAAEDSIEVEFVKTSDELCIAPVQWDASQTLHRGPLVCEAVPACATTSPAGLLPMLIGGLLVASRRSRL